MALPSLLAAVLVLPLLSVNAAIDANKQAELSREIREEFRRTGFNWMSPVHFKNVRKTNNHKPYMFLFTSTSCADCREMLRQLENESPQFNSNLSAQFNAILVLDDYSLEFGKEYAPEGHDYEPRVIFADPDGRIRLDLVNPKGDRTAPYFYTTARQMLWAMRLVLEEYRQEQLPFPSDLDEDLPS